MSDKQPYVAYNIYHFYDGPLTFTGAEKNNKDPWHLLYFEYDDAATDDFGEGFGFYEERVYRAYLCGTNTFEYVIESDIDRSIANR